MHLRTLGKLRLVGSSLTRPKPLLLVAYLALEGPTARSRLARLFFADAGDPSDALSTTIRRLRAAGLGLEVSDNYVACDVECDALDLLAALDAAEIEAAAAAYAGPFFDDLTLNLGPELEEWVFALREYIAGRLRAALLGAAEEALTQGDTVAAARHAEAARGLDGAGELDSDELARLYLVFQALGHHSARSLRDEALSAGVNLPAAASVPSVAPRLPRVVELPTFSTPLIGRDIELAEIAQALAREDCQLLTLHGPAGVGKSRLARQAAFEQARSGRFDQAVAHLALDAIEDVRLLPGAIAAALDLPPLPAEDPWAALADHLGDAGYLLVLDNFEHLIAAAPDVGKLLDACPRLSLIVTSRQRLNLAAEWVVSLGGMSVPSAEMKLEEAVLVDALKLFVNRAQRADIRFRLTEADLPDALEICRAVDAFPLGIELAAAWTRAMSLSEIARGLTTDLGILDERPHGQAHARSSLRSALEQSWVLLTPEEQQVAARLSVFKGGFRREAATAVAGATIPQLLSLVDKSLLRPQADGRFERHALLGQFLAGKLAERGADAPETAARHGHYYRDLLIASRHRTEAERAHGVFELLEQEEGNVLASLGWAVGTRDATTLLALSEPLLWYFPMRGRFTVGEAVFARAIEQIDPSDASLFEATASLMLGRAWLARYAGDLALAKTLGAKAEGLARASGSTAQLSRALDIRGQVLTYDGRYAEAKSLLAEGAALARGGGDSLGLVRMLSNLALAEALSGAYDEAESHLGEALAPFEDGRLAESFDVVAIWLAYGVLHRCAGRIEAARQALGRALDLADRQGYSGPVPVLTALLAEATFEWEMATAVHGAGAQTLARQAAELVEHSSETMALTLTRVVESRLALRAGDSEKAIAIAAAGASVAWRNNNLVMLFWALLPLGRALAAAGQASSARRVLRLTQEHPATPSWLREGAKAVELEMANGTATGGAQAAAAAPGFDLPAILREVLSMTVEPSGPAN